MDSDSVVDTPPIGILLGNPDARLFRRTPKVAEY